MAECKPKQKSGPVTESNLSSISKILNILLGVFSMMQKPAQNVPPFLLLVGAELRPGMSARDLAANVISRMESDAGIPMGNIFGDGPNAMASAALIQAQEQISHIQTKAKVNTVIKPGAIQITAVGGNAGGPIVVQGANVSLTQNTGILQ
jgi:hypothetical protein